VIVPSSSHEAYAIDGTASSPSNRQCQGKAQTVPPPTTVTMAQPLPVYDVSVDELRVALSWCIPDLELKPIQVQ
jgi:hypothetical protein